MKPSRTDPPPIHLHTALAFEVGLGVVALVIAWHQRLPVSKLLEIRVAPFGWGIAATLPMMAGLVVLLRSGHPPVVRLRVKIRRIARHLFPSRSHIELAAVAIAAGWGEELLFRGAGQLLVTRWSTPWVAILVTSLLFGLVHALTRTYFLLATLVGVYFGLLTWWAESLIPAIVAHTLYDFVALSRLVRRRPRRRLPET